MALALVILWVLPSVLIGLAVGYWVGRQQAPACENDVEQVGLERAQLIKALAGMVESAERLSTDVDSHSHELRQVGRQVGEMNLPGELAGAQRGVLEQIIAVIDSNKRLEDDLVCARYQLETQARELDRTRMEARTDALSGVSNRKAFDETLQYMLAHAKRRQATFSIILLDIDHFKWINDTHGHPAGDLVVREVAGELARLVREKDSVFRLGGDEFVILLADLKGPDATKVGERIRGTVARTNYPLGEAEEQVSVTCSLGIAQRESSDTAETLVARADRALYGAKEAGRNSVRYLATTEAEPLADAMCASAVG